MTGFLDDAAARQFVAGVASLVGAAPQVVFAPGPPSVAADGTVSLPPGLWSSRGAEVLFAAVCHELAHWVSGACARWLERTSRDYPDALRGLAHTMFNGCVDVADETGMELLLPRSTLYFRASNEAAVVRAVAGGSLPATAPARAASPELLLCVGLMLVRAPPRSRARKLLRGWRTRTAGVARVERLLRRAIDRPGDRLRRGERRWGELERITRALVELVLELFPTPAGLPAGDGLSGLRAPVLAAEIAAAAARLAAAGGPLASWQRDPDALPYDEGLYRGYYDAFAASQLTRTRASVVEHGRASGPRLSRPARAAIDGRCFARPRADTTRDVAFALVVDHSYSMRSIAGVVLPAAHALADALAEIGRVRVAVFRFAADAAPLAPRELRALPGGTATRTDLGVTLATQWLRRQPERVRRMVLLTDGVPDCVPAAQAAVRTAVQAGVQVLVGSVGPASAICQELFPGALCIELDASDLGARLRGIMAMLR